MQWEPKFWFAFLRHFSSRTKLSVPPIAYADDADADDDDRSIWAQQLSWIFCVLLPPIAPQSYAK